MDAKQVIKIEHKEIREILDEIEKMLNSEQESYYYINLLDKFEIIWDKHEEREERFLKLFAEQNIDFPYYKMMLGEHKQLRGHWKVIKDAIKGADKSKIFIAFDFNDVDICWAGF